MCLPVRFLRIRGRHTLGGSPSVPDSGNEWLHPDFRMLSHPQRPRFRKRPRRPGFMTLSPPSVIDPGEQRLHPGFLMLEWASGRGATSQGDADSRPTFENGRPRARNGQPHAGGRIGFQSATTLRRYAPPPASEREISITAAWGHAHHNNAKHLFWVGASLVGGITFVVFRP